MSTWILDRMVFFIEKNEINSYLIELNRGVILIVVLSQLNEPSYGYDLAKNINNLGYRIEQATLYPMLRRLEKNNIVRSTQDLTDNRKKKYYSLTSDGKELYYSLLEEYKKINNIVEVLINESNR